MNHYCSLPLWRPWRTLRRSELPPGLFLWLAENGSMTARLRQKMRQTLTLQVHYHGWQRPRRDEMPCLELVKPIKVLTREIMLYGDHQPWLAARSLFSPRSLLGKGRRLLKLGVQPLGEVLFADKKLVRSELEIALLRSHHRDYRRAVQCLAKPPLTLWARRRVFYFQHQPILVSEIFLPPLWESEPL